jgi:hypothetical protein
MSELGDPVAITVVANEAQAEMVCGLLRAEGITCTHRITNFAFGSGGEMPLSGGGPREVMVRPGDQAAARALLAEVNE